MRDEKEKREKERKTIIKFFAVMWILFIIFVSAIASGGENGTLFTGIEALQRFEFFHWLNPKTWGACLKSSIVYWAAVGLFIIYEEKFKHDASGIEAGSAHWNTTVEEYNIDHSEPFGSEKFSDAPNRPHGCKDDSWMEGKKNYNNPKERADGSFVKPVPGSPNMIESATVRLSTADMKTHVNNNVFIVGGAGTGKSRFFIKPNILQMNCSYVVTDPSGELLKSMHNVLKDNGYNIKVFNLVDMTHSCKYNPFKYVRSETDVSILVDCFISNTTGPDQKSGDPFWDKSEKALLSALIFYLVDIADTEFKKFSTILWLVQQAQLDEAGNKQSQKSEFGFSIDSPLDELFNGTKKIVKEVIKSDEDDGEEKEVLMAADVTDENEINLIKSKIKTSLCLTNYKTFKLGGTKTLKSILISAAVRLNPFSIPAIQNLTDEDSVELDTVGDKLTCFFAIIPQTNSTFNFLISMLFSQMFESLYYKGSKIPDSRLNYHVRFLLDEFANIGKIPEFPQKISTCRKYNISTTIVLQSIAQIKMLYKDDYETIIGNCDTAICLGTNEQTTADYFSKKLGKATITSRSKSTQVGKSGGSMSFNQTGRELMTPDEIMTMKFDECIVMMNHISPFFDKKYPLETHPQFQYTGDADKKNFYFLENDDDFLCVDNTKKHSKNVIKDKFDKDKDNKKYVPVNLKELMEEGGVLDNNPEEDNYYRIKSIDKDEDRSMLAIEREKMVKAIIECKNNGYKTPYYDANNIEPSLVKPLITRTMNQLYNEVDELVCCYLDIKGENYHFYGCAKSEENSNGLQVFKNIFMLPIAINKNKDFAIYNIEDNCDDSKLTNQVYIGLQAGADVVSSNNIDDNMNDPKWRF